MNYKKRQQLTDKRNSEVDERGLRTYTVFDQRPPTEKRVAGKIQYEANLVRVGEVKAENSSKALDEAKKKGLADKPVIWSPETERMMRQHYQNQRQARFNQDRD